MVILLLILYDHAVILSSKISAWALTYECLQEHDGSEDINSLYEFYRYETQKTRDKRLALAGGQLLQQCQLVTKQQKEQNRSLTNRSTAPYNKNE